MSEFLTGNRNKPKWPIYCRFGMHTERKKINLTDLICVFYCVRLNMWQKRETELIYLYEIFHCAITSLDPTKPHLNLWQKFVILVLSSPPAGYQPSTSNNMQNWNAQILCCRHSWARDEENSDRLKWSQAIVHLGMLWSWRQIRIRKHGGVFASPLKYFGERNEPKLCEAMLKCTPIPPGKRFTTVRWKPPIFRTLFYLEASAFMILSNEFWKGFVMSLGQRKMLRTGEGICNPWNIQGDTRLFSRDSLTSFEVPFLTCQ